MPIKKRALALVVAGLLGGVLTAPPSVGDTPPAEVLFERAETLYRQLRVVDPEATDAGAWSALALAFSEIPERYPASILAGAALWRIGDIHLRRWRAGSSVSADHVRNTWEELIRRYPGNPHAPRALLRLGDLAVIDGRGEEAASRYWYQVLERYPASDEASLARGRLTGDLSAALPVVETPEPESREVEVARSDEARHGSESLALGDAHPAEGEALPAPETSSPDGTQARSEEESGRHGVAGDADRAPDGDIDVPGAAAHYGKVLAVRHYADATHTRVVLDLERPMEHLVGEAQDPPRLFVDLIGASLPPDLPRELDVDGQGLAQVRLALNRPGVVRVVFDLESAARYSLFTLAGPDRLVVDIPSPALSERLERARRPPAPEGGDEARVLNLGVRHIVLDPGHGGSAPGAIGRSGITEKDLALDIGRRLAEQLRSKPGYRVTMTREDDASLELETRPRLANQAQADLFVSIHVNSSNNRKLAGFETYYLDLATDPAAAETAARENYGTGGGVGSLDDILDEIVKNANKRESRDLAQAIQDSLVLQMSRFYPDIRDLGVKHAPFVVLVGAQMPAVLVEASFVSNAQEEERLRDPEYRQRVADAIHVGIENYIERRRMTTAH